MAQQVRVINFRLLMKFLRKRESESLDKGSLTLEMKSDQSGCLVNSSTHEILETWSDVGELNDIIKDTMLSESEHNKQKLFNARSGVNPLPE